MEKRYIGDLEVSEIGMGCMGFSHGYGKIPVEDVAQVMAVLIKDGLIRGWGLSQVDVDTLSRAHQITPVTAVFCLVK